MDIDIELENLKYMLNTNQIDPREYSHRVQELMSERNKEKKKSTKMTKKGVGVGFFIIGIILFALLIWIDSLSVEKEIAFADLRNLSAPEQKTTSGSRYMGASDAIVNLQHLAEYKIQGRVVDVQDYIPYSIESFLSPVDFGIAWGELARDENIEKLEFNSIGNRFLKYNTADREWLADFGGWDGVGRYIANNHIIPANKEIKKLIDAVRIDDYVEITGYLVRVTCKNPNFRWSSSLSRADDGAGACEVLLVEDIKWLEEAKK